jgi:hypothetical protein
MYILQSSISTTLPLQDHKIKKTCVQMEFLLHMNLSRTYFETWRHLSPILEMEVW